MPLESGRMLQERYLIEETIREHANGGVYRAKDQTTEQPCIVKEFLGLRIEEFTQHASALLNRIHPTLPEVFDHFSVDDDHHYLIMEAVEGESLTDRLKRRKTLTEREAANWMGQVLAALDYLHIRTPPILHGDVKPDNILITPDAEAVLVDYGIGQRLNPHTPATFVAPEQVSGQAEPRSDVYAVGATLYTALSGRVPGQSDSGLADRFAITPLHNLNETLSPAIVRVVEKAMEHKSEARYESIREMRKALGRAAARVSDDPTAEKKTPPQEAPSPPQRQRFGWGFIAIGLAIVAIFGIGYLTGSAPESSEEIAAVPTVTVEAAVQGVARSPEATATALPQPSATHPVTNALGRDIELPTEVATTEPTHELAVTSAPLILTSRPTPGLGSTLVSDMDAATLVYIPAGEFLMGSNFDDPFALEDERPQHIINMPAYWIDQTEVTNDQYAACVAVGNCTEPRFFHSSLRVNYYGNPDYAGHPVVWVNWQQAAAYCDWAGRRLPTEAEWEKAARGEDGRIYPWGNEEAAAAHANFDILNRDTEPVGSFPDGASPYGVLDMAGNVAEWVDAYYTTTYYSHYANLTATPEAFLRFHDGLRVLRNGAWNDKGVNLRAAFRRFAPIIEYSINNVGFRCAISIEA